MKNASEKKIKILVFPCGSEIGLEIFRSLRYSRHIELIGGSSIDDHGKYVFDNYIGDIPFITSEEVIPHLKKIVAENNIDAIYPTMDKVIWKLKKHENELGCKVISSPAETTEICLSKTRTYKHFLGITPTPELFNTLGEIKKYPVFVKPDIGYGARNVSVANNENELTNIIGIGNTNYVITEFLPGEEFTVDCFTDKNGELKFTGPRRRMRVKGGISVNTVPVKERAVEFREKAEAINKSLRFRGAWFFQVKEDDKGTLKLLEVAARPGGSSALFRGTGINFALLSVFDAFDKDVEVISNNYNIEIDRALDVMYKLDIEYSTVFVDFDDCILINGNLNSDLIAFLYRAFNAKKEIVLLTKHDGNIHDKLKKYRIDSLFDKIISISREEEKSSYIKIKDAIFIDDSFSERKLVAQKTNIPVFSPDMVESLL